MTFSSFVTASRFVVKCFVAATLVIAVFPQAASAQWWPAPKQPATQPQSQRPHPAVVRVVSPEGDATSYGSGTLVEVNEHYGLVVTNWHVVRDSREGLSVVFPDGFQSAARVAKADRVWDLAALVIRRPTATPVPLSSRPPQRGEVLTIAGYGGGSYRAASGRVTQYVSPGDKQPFEMVEVAVAARNGDSGGPMFNSRGELAGVLFGEGRGRTSGSYAGRVDRFLQSVRLGKQPAMQMARSQRVAPRPTRPPEAIAQAPSSTQQPPPVISNDRRQPQAEWSGNAGRSAESNDRASSLPGGPIASTVAAEPIGAGEFLGHTPLEQIKTFLAIVGAFTLVLVAMRVLIPA